MTATMWYEVYYSDIKPFTVVRETDKCLFYTCPYSKEPVRRNKEHNLFRTRAEAEAYLLKVSEAKLADHRKQVARLESLVNSLRAPKKEETA